MSKVSAGRFIELDSKRLVFVGNLLDKDGYGIGFRNSEGEITKFALSAEAATALVNMLTDPDAGVPIDEPTFLCDKTEVTVYRWRAVVTEVEAAGLPDDR